MKTINILYCGKCPNVRHSGAFTEGGAKSVCGHKGACYIVRANTHRDEPYHWIHRVLEINNAGYLVIPDWCPL